MSLLRNNKTRHHIALIACCKSKQTTQKPLPAMELYAGALFQAQLAYARKTLQIADEHIWILSAKHGLLSCMESITTYEHSLYDVSARERAAWGELVCSKLETQYVPTAVGTVYLMAGKLYRQSLHFASKWQVAIPHPPGYGIGQQIKWYRSA